MALPKALLMASLCATLGLSMASLAESRREGHWETSVQVIFTDSEKVSGDNQSAIDIDNDVGVGFGVAYHLTNNFALGFDFSYLEPDYKAVFNTDQRGLVSVDHEMEVNTGQFSGIWHVLDGAFTPFLRAGLGWTYIDSNVSDGPPVTGCWWDPWYGYICQNFYDTYDDTSFSYSFGAGIRFDLGGGLLLKGSINHIEIDADNSFNPGISNARFEMGWTF